ncbi:hypothetical protein DERF_004868 [Dermatophagoides farinae]|uniref:Uncharacterized protein n=1 Tax=Dermatophagoides farinae TaxID=6954 RepID=A0A922I4K8_DERFA|nr:hypothetical protein DERF_004868 [Dermatophagoides farinae]
MIKNSVTTSTIWIFFSNKIWTISSPSSIYSNANYSIQQRQKRKKNKLISLLLIFIDIIVEKLSYPFIHSVYIQKN